MRPPAAVQHGGMDIVLVGTLVIVGVVALILVVVDHVLVRPSNCYVLFSEGSDGREGAPTPPGTWAPGRLAS